MHITIKCRDEKHCILSTQTLYQRGATIYCNVKSVYSCIGKQMLTERLHVSSRNRKTCLDTVLYILMKHDKSILFCHNVDILVEKKKKDQLHSINR